MDMAEYSGPTQSILNRLVEESGETAHREVYDAIRIRLKK